jgi:hypothetical protein
MKLQCDTLTRTKYIHSVEETLIRETGNDRDIRRSTVAILAMTLFTRLNKLYKIVRGRSGSGH